MLEQRIDAEGIRRHHSTFGVEEARSQMSYWYDHGAGKYTVADEEGAFLRAVVATPGQRACGRRRRDFSPARAPVTARVRDRAAGGEMMSQQRLVRLMPWLATIALLLIWELACRALHLREFVLPAPSVIARAFVTYADPILYHSGWTLFITLLGFGCAIIGGMLLGMAIGFSALVYQGLYPLLVAFNAIPKVAEVPILVLWFGIGAVPAVITSFIISFFPIAVNVATGIATVEPELADVLRSLGATKLDVLIKVGLPRAMPYLFASLKVAITLAFVGSVLAETMAGNAGLGYLMVTASARFEVALVFAGLIAVAVMAVALFEICVLIEKRTTRWAFRGAFAG
jgi:NitT/TauT family transport system permease protein